MCVRSVSERGVRGGNSVLLCDCRSVDAYLGRASAVFDTVLGGGGGAGSVGAG